MNAHDIVIGGIRIPLDSAYGLEQSYDALEAGSTVLRMLNGAAIKQTHWSKRRTTITGSGRYPPGLAGLDYSGPLEIQCAAPLIIASAASNVITLPAARRADWVPAGYAVVDGRMMPVACSVVGNIATLGTLAGAQNYQCMYWPVLTVYATPPRTTFNGRQPSLSGWQIDAEEA